MVLVYTIIARCEKLARKNTTICVKNHHLCQYIVLLDTLPIHSKIIGCLTLKSHSDEIIGLVVVRVGATKP